MKGLSTTILIVVTAIVILVAALVVLTIFGGGIGNVSTLTNFKTQCIVQCQITCKMGALPPTWNLEVSVEGQKRTCAGETGISVQCGGVCGSVTTSTDGTTGTIACANRAPGQCTGDCQWCSGKGCISISDKC